MVEVTPRVGVIFHWLRVGHVSFSIRRNTFNSFHSRHYERSTFHLLAESVRIFNSRRKFSALKYNVKCMCLICDNYPIMFVCDALNRCRVSIRCLKIFIQTSLTDEFCWKQCLCFLRLSGVYFRLGACKFIRVLFVRMRCPSVTTRQETEGTFGIV